MKERDATGYYGLWRCGEFDEDMSNLVNPVKLLSPRLRSHRRRGIINQMNDPTPQSAHVSGCRRRATSLGWVVGPGRLYHHIHRRGRTGCCREGDGGRMAVALWQPLL